MKLHRMPFQNWDDEHTVLLRKERGANTKHKEADDRWWNDPEWYCRQHFWTNKEGHGPYFLNRRCRALMSRHGPFRGIYKDGEGLVDAAPGEDAYVVCPGPSLSGVDLGPLAGRLTLAVNSAGFLFEPRYWVMAESGYARWLISRGKTSWGEHLAGRELISTARVATVLREFERAQPAKAKYAACHVVRWEEEFVVPARTPAVSITNALVSAWEMGCPRVFVLGLDLSKDGGAYVDGVPFTDEGARNPFDDQIRALAQFRLPDFEVVNCSPLSRESLPFRHLPYDELMETLS